MLKLDRTKLSSVVKFEPAAPVGDRQTKRFQTADASAHASAQSAQAEQLFPHLYGTIDFDAVVDELDVGRVQDGSFVSIDGIASQAQ